MKVYFPDYYTEAHRSPERQQDLVTALTAEGLTCVKTLDASVDVVFCGTVWQSEHLLEIVRKRTVPVVHYNFDLYPWQVDGKSEDCWKPHLWKQYLEQLRNCAAVIVPGETTRKRTQELAGRDSVVVRAPVKLWEPLKRSTDSYVVDVMRKYPDPNRHAVSEACKELGIRCIETGANLPWDEFRATITNARLLVSAYYEASTGGLTLLEGFAHGVPVLLSNSPYNGAQEYFGTAGNYFQWDKPESLRTCIEDLLAYPPQYSAADNRQWVVDNFSDAKFAEGVAEVLRCSTT